jgi:dUTPase
MAQQQEQSPVDYKYTLYLYINDTDEEPKYIPSEQEINKDPSLKNKDGYFLSNKEINKIDLKVKCEMVKHVGENKVPSAFYLYPRSSISKTILRMANSVGIVDSGYRGNLMGMFDCNETKYLDLKYFRMVQICSPTLEPFKVVLVNSDLELSSTPRNTRGIGSTGV